MEMLHKVGTLVS